MKSSSRFIIAVHILSIIHLATALRKLDNTKSEIIAQSVNTNPVVIRRLMKMLKDAGLVESRKGVHGGFTLAKAAPGINLYEIYSAVEKSGLFHAPYNEPNINCPVGRNLNGALKGVLGNAEAAMYGVLKKVTLEDIINEITAIETSSKK
ncbi:MAG: Rrf2 family transcriptional regulator [bacterium]|nr:Rrf2 family transcriptional regulator [bacterium]